MVKYKPTGFMAFWIYECFCKYLEGHDKYQDFNNLPYYNFYHTQWNTRVHLYRQSNFFQLLEMKLPNNTDNFFRCYAYYWLNSKGKKFHAQNIIENELKIYNNNEYILDIGLKNTFINDIHTIFKYSFENKIKINEMFNKKYGMPDIYSLFFDNKISIYTILIYYKIFKININIDPMNVIDNNKIQYIISIFDKFYPIINSFFENTNWKKLILIEMQKFKEE